MKCLVLVCLVAAVSADANLKALFRAKWNTFKAVHGKSYDHVEDQLRLNAFLENTFHIEQHNTRYAQGLETYQLDHNEMSDMTMEEFEKMKGGFEPREALESQQNITVFDDSAISDESLPDEVDWTPYVPDVRNQGGCASCYTFSAVGALEGALVRKIEKATGETRPVRLSEQELVDCTLNYGNYACGGGMMNQCFKYVGDMKGISYNEKYPYRGWFQGCKKDIDRETEATVTGITVVPRTERAVTKALATIGPLSVAVHSANIPFRFYRDGIITDPACDVYRTNHAVVLVGYGEDKGIKYYKIKNSYGTSWGQNGFAKIARDRCHITKFASFPTL